VSKPLKVQCPHCRTEAEWGNNPHPPFCSDRCRQIDLGNWATERYRIAADEAPEEKTPASKEKQEE